LDVDDRYIAAMPNCIPRFCYHQFSGLPPTTEANLKTYSRQNQNTFYGQLFPENRAVYEIKWKGVVEPEATDINIIQRMCIAWLIIKATDTQNM
jgi:hypothetical protein